MSLSKEEIEKIYKIKEKLLVTYKALSNEKKKNEISRNINKLEQIIKDVEEGKGVDLKALNIFSEELKSSKPKKVLDESTRISYIAKVESLRIHKNSKDSEMDQIYSFIMYFEDNFSIPLGASYLKVDYYLSKKRDTFFYHFDSLKLLLKEYINDLETISEIKFKEQVEKYKARLEQQKKYFLVKLSELLHELKDFIDEILSDLEKGRKSLFNPEDDFTNKFSLEEKSVFEGMKMRPIIDEIHYFCDDFIEILRMPDFRKNSKK